MSAESNNRSGFGMAALLLALPLWAGCVTEGGGRQTRSLPAQPLSAEATTVQIYATPPRDTDANGYADTVSVTIFLWDEQRYPGPILISGTMKFEFRRPDGTVLAQWAMTREQVASAAQQFHPGPGYSFNLGLPGAGIPDKLDAQAVDLSVVFTPEKGKPVASLGGTTLRLGRIGI